MPKHITSDIIETAMVFAAGFGKRMRPITDKIPKPMVKISGKTMIDSALDKLAAAGVKKAVVNSHYLYDVLESYLAQRKNPSPKIKISREQDVILETGGGIVKALPILGSKPFFSVNSDIVWIDAKKPALQRMLEKWNPEKMDVLMLLHPVEKAVGYEGKGDFDLLPDGRLKRNDNGKHEYVFTGVMITKPEIFQGLEEKPFSLYRDFLHAKYIQKDGSLNKMFGLVHDGQWLHIGTPEGIEVAERYISGLTS